MFSIFGSKPCPTCASKTEELQALALKFEEKESKILDMQGEIQHLSRALEWFQKHLNGDEKFSAHQLATSAQLLELKTENQRLQRALDEAHQKLEQSAALPPEVTPVATLQTTPKTIYIASSTRANFHYPTCVWMENLPEKKRVVFSSHEEAVKAGYKPCKTCCP